MNNFVESRTATSVLLDELSRIDEEIARLSSEREQTRRLIERIRRRELSSVSVTRRNSIDKIIAEDAIIKILKSNNMPMKVRAIKERLIAGGIDLKPATLRSHLFRLREQNKIQKIDTGSYSALND
jgi:DNA-binding transcriptional ArsR family regulator